MVYQQELLAQVKIQLTQRIKLMSSFELTQRTEFLHLIRSSPTFSILFTPLSFSSQPSPSWTTTAQIRLKRQVEKETRKKELLEDLRLLACNEGRRVEEERRGGGGGGGGGGGEGDVRRKQFDITLVGCQWLSFEHFKLNSAAP